MMAVRRSTAFFAYLGLMLALLGTMALHAEYQRLAAWSSLLEMKRMVHEWRLTDLCLFPEANYTRHLSQADYHTAFQDAPGSLEHFPSGMLVQPPALLTRE